jgi:hypothetical protein
VSARFCVLIFPWFGLKYINEEGWASELVMQPQKRNGAKKARALLVEKNFSFASFRGENRAW